jgi:hypothetical protein
VEAANGWLKASISKHNAHFAVAPEQEGTMFVADRDGAYREILCVQAERPGPPRQNCGGARAMLVVLRSTTRAGGDVPSPRDYIRAFTI